MSIPTCCTKELISKWNTRYSCNIWAITIRCFFRSCVGKIGSESHRHKRSNLAKPPFIRYRPQFSKCRISSDCDRYHRHLLLATDSIYEDLLKECSLTIFLQDVVDLNYHLSRIPANIAIIIVHTKYRSTRLYFEIINVMITRLGNVSLYVDNQSQYDDVVNKCDNLEKTCTNLLSLAPVVEQNKNWKSEHPVSSSMLDLYDSRWLPINAITPASNKRYLTSGDFQMQLLALTMCTRNRRHNLFYEVSPERMSIVWVIYFIVEIKTR